MEITLNNKELQAAFTTANEVEIEDKGQDRIIYNGKTYHYNSTSERDKDINILHEYITKLNTAMFF